MSYQSVNEPCSILEQDGKCGETESLAIIKEFKRQYESKMSKIDNEAGGDNLPGLQAKVLLQREWIRDLTAQNELLIRAMEELEKEATERVIMLESRLKHQAEKTNEGCSGGPCLDYNKINAELENNLKEKEKQLVDISAKYNQKCEEAITAKRNSLDTQETYEVLKNKIQVLQTEIENLRKTLVQEQEHLNEAEKRIHSLMTERDALKIKNDELLNQFKIEKNNYIKEIDELKRKNKLSENAYVELEKANATHTLELESSKRTSRVLNMDLEKLASEINEKDSIITSLEKDLRELQKQNKKALDQIVTLTVENQAKVEKIEENQAILKHLEDRKEIITGVKNFECTDAEVSFNSSNHKNIADKGSSRSVKFNDAAVASSSSGNWVTSDSASTDDEEIERQTVRVVKTLEQTVSTDSSDQRRINELEKALERALTERENERSKHNQEIFNLRKAIEELEKSGQNEICKGHNLQNAEDCSPFKEELMRLLDENKNQICENANLQMQLMSLTNDLQNMQQIASEARELQLILQNTNEEMQYQANLAQDLPQKGLINYGSSEQYPVEPTSSNTSEVYQAQPHLYKPEYVIRETTVIGGSPPKEAQADFTLRETTVNYGGYQIIPDSGGRKAQKELTILEANIYGVSPSNAVTSESFDSASQADFVIKETNIYDVSPISAEQISSCICPNAISKSAPGDDYIDPNDINEMQLSLDQRTGELQQFENILCETQEKLDNSLFENEQLKNELQHLIIQLQNYERGELITSDECAACTQKEIEACRDNLGELKNKFFKMKMLLCEKNEQYAELEAKYFMQGNMCDCLRQQLEGQRIHYEGDIGDLKHTINELDDKLLKLENNYALVQEEYKQSQALLIESALREAKLQKDLQNQNYLDEKVKLYENEGKGLCECVSKLEDENKDFKKLLSSKEKQLGLSISHVNELKTAAKAQIQMAREEINNMKEEMHKLAHDHENIKSKNEKLQIHICNLQTCHTKFEEESTKAKEDIKHCLCELQAVKKEREILENVNQTLRNELKILHGAYENLSNDFQHLAEDMEIYNSRCICNCQQYMRQRGGGITVGKQEVENPQHDERSQTVCWSLESPSSQSPASEIGNSSEWLTYEECEKETDDITAELWLHRVESMTHQLKKSNNYWKRLSDKDFANSKNK